MKTLHLLAGMAMLGGTALTAVPASAGVSVGIGIGIPGPGYYSVRAGRCANPRFAYYHPYQCGYPRYREPVFIDGAWIDEPLYYRTSGSERYFWWHGGWRVGHGDWDGRHFDRANYHRDFDRDRDDHRDNDDHPH